MSSEGATRQRSRLVGSCPGVLGRYAWADVASAAFGSEQNRRHGHTNHDETIDRGHRRPARAGSRCFFYGPLEPFFDQTWKPDDIVEVK